MPTTPKVKMNGNLASPSAVEGYRSGVNPYGSMPNAMTGITSDLPVPSQNVRCILLPSALDLFLTLG